jgi:hypothetical protein
MKTETILGGHPDEDTSTPTFGSRQGVFYWRLWPHSLIDHSVFTLSCPLTVGNLLTMLRRVGRIRRIWRDCEDPQVESPSDSKYKTLLQKQLWITVNKTIRNLFVPRFKSNYVSIDLQKILPP